MIGWTIGAGVDYRLTSNVILRAEYLYVDLRSNDLSVPFGGVTASTKLDFSTNLARVGVVYKF